MENPFFAAMCSFIGADGFDFVNTFVLLEGEKLMDVQLFAGVPSISH